MGRPRKQEVLDEYRRVYFECNGKHIARIEENRGWFYLVFYYDGGTYRANARRLKRIVEMTETLKRRITERKANVLLEK